MKSRRPNSMVSQEEILADLKRVYREYGNLAKLTYEINGRHAPSTAERAFGSWNQAKQAAGVPLSHVQGQSQHQYSKTIGLERHTVRTGTRNCNLCGKPFQSWDLTKNYRCRRCEYYIREIQHEHLEDYMDCA